MAKASTRNPGKSASSSRRIAKKPPAKAGSALAGASGRKVTKSTAKAASPHPVSPLAPRSVEALPALAGVSLGTGSAGIKYKDRSDVLVAVMAPGTQAAGVFTRSRTASAPVEWCRAQLGAGSARALVVNSGNANAFTGKLGDEAVRAVADAAAEAAGCRPSEVFLASTGVIGEPLPAQKITKVLGDLVDAASPGAWLEAARAIMTTDTYPKLATATAMIGDHAVTINGIAKGSGMIAPDMATMLSFVFTDAAIPAPVLHDLLSEGVATSFNCITVDSDTSTSDTLMLFATGQGPAHPKVRKAGGNKLADFRQKLGAVLRDLALQVVRDGEGAQKLIQIDVTGARSDTSAHRIGMAIANSPLVKTAIAGSDANWGRVVMAVGKAGEPADRDRLKIAFGGHVVAEKGQRAEGYDEAAATAAVSGRAVEIAVDLGLGKGAARVWTCDLTDGYIRINGSYRS